MSFPAPSGRSLRRASIALALASAAPLAAQIGTTIQALPSPDDPAEKLAAALRTLAVSPRDLGALIEAGREALTLGDPNAAVGFFGRAGEVAPRDGRVKAGLGASLVQLEKPRDALRYFQEASALGVPDVDLAEDRGLAYDLVGDTVHAQRDYRTVLAAEPDDDAVRRRLALSQGIAGDRAGAIATLDPLIRKRDIAAWRAQTFVLAMTGDTAGANAITRVMLPQQQAMLQPFLVRLATLAPADKARAVHFGEMPAAGRSYSNTQLASIGTPATYAASPAPALVQAPLRVAPAAVAPASPPRQAPAPAAPAVVTAAAVTPASPQPTSAAAPSPSAVATSPPRSPAAGRERFVSASGVTMRRIEHSPQEMLAFGMPRYEYVPDGAVARTQPRASAAAPLQALAVPAPSPVAAVIAGSPQAPAAPPVATSGTAAPSIATTIPAAARLIVATPLAAPPPPVLPAGEVAGPAMPLGASGLGGHFDLPHEIADRRPVPRAVQPTARPPVAAPPRAATLAVDATPSDPVAANPTVTVARRVHGGATELAAAETPPVRRGRAHAVTASTAGDDDAKPVGKTSDHKDRADGTHVADRTEKAVDDSDAPAGRKGKRGDRTRTTARDAEAEASPAKHGRDRTTSGRAADNAADDDKAGRTGRGKIRNDRKRDGDATADDGKAKKIGPDKSGKDRDDKTDRKDKTDKPDSAPKVYVQVAGGANKADMDKAWAGVKAKAPDLMKGRTPSTTPLHATNRLLVGPFKDEDGAQAFVNRMAGKGLSGFTVKSARGQKVEKVDTGG